MKFAFILLVLSSSVSFYEIQTHTILAKTYSSSGLRTEAQNNSKNDVISVQLIVFEINHTRTSQTSKKITRKTKSFHEIRVEMLNLTKYKNKLIKKILQPISNRKQMNCNPPDAF